MEAEVLINIDSTLLPIFLLKIIEAVGVEVTITVEVYCPTLANFHNGSVAALKQDHSAAGAVHLVVVVISTLGMKHGEIPAGTGTKQLSCKTWRMARISF